MGRKKTEVQPRQSADRSAKSASVQFVFHLRPHTSYYTRLNNNKKTKLYGLITPALVMKKFLPSFLINNIPAGPGISIHTWAMGAAWLRVPLNLIWRLIPRNEHGRCTRLAPPARSFDALAFLPLPPLQQVAISCQKPNQFSQKLRSFCGNYQKQGRLTWIWTGQKDWKGAGENVLPGLYKH